MPSPYSTPSSGIARSSSATPGEGTCSSTWSPAFPRLRAAASARRARWQSVTPGMEGFNNGDGAAPTRTLPALDTTHIERIEAERPLTAEEQDEVLEALDVDPATSPSPAAATPFVPIRNLRSKRWRAASPALMEALPSLADPPRGDRRSRRCSCTCAGGPMPAMPAQDTAAVMGPRGSVVVVPGHRPLPVAGAARSRPPTRGRVHDVRRRLRDVPERAVGRWVGQAARESAAGRRQPRRLPGSTVAPWSSPARRARGRSARS